MKAVGLHASDTHLRLRLGDEEFAFKQLVDAAIKHKVEYIALAGDLLDKQSNRSRVIAFLGSQLRRCVKAEIDVLYTQGQHDFDDPPWFSVHRGTKHLHDKVLSYGDGVVNMYGLDWQPYGKLQEMLVKIPDEADTLICHQVWAEWMGDITSPQGSFSEVPKHITRVHTGDYHKWILETRMNAGNKKTTILSTGATTQQKINEPSTHHYALLMADGKFEKKNLASRVMLNSGLLTRPEDLDNFISELPSIMQTALQRGAADELPDALLKPYLRVQFHSALFETVRRVEKIVGNEAILHFLEVVPEARQAAYDKSRLLKGNSITPLSVLGDEVNQEEDPDVYALVHAMLSSTDRDATFAEWRNNVLEAD